MDTLAKGLFLLQEKFAPVKNWEHCHLDLFCKLMSQEVFLWYKVSKVVVTLKRDRQNSSPKCHFWKGLYLNSYCLAGMLSFYKSKGLLFFGRSCFNLIIIDIFCAGPKKGHLWKKGNWSCFILQNYVEKTWRVSVLKPVGA